MTFTAQKIAKLAAGDVLTDAGSPGLRLHCGSTTRTWVYRFKLNGKRKLLTLGHYPATTIASAVAAWHKARELQRQGNDPAAVAKVAKPVALAEITVNDIVENYLAECVKPSRSAKSFRTCAGLLRNHVLPKIGNRPAISVTRREAGDLLLAAQAGGLKLTARKLRAELRAVYRYALLRDVISCINPFDDLAVKLAPRGRSTNYLSQAELGAFLRWLPASGMTIECRDALEITLRVAARSGEIVALAWANVDLKRGTCELRNTKTDSPRTIILPRKVVDILRRRRAATVGSDYVFPSPVVGQHFAQAALHSAIQRVALPVKFSPHDLRRSARTLMAQLNVRHEIAEAALGHAQAGMAAIYNQHTFTNEVGDALKVMNDTLDRLAA